MSAAALARIDGVTRSLAGAYSPSMLASAVHTLSQLYTRDRAQLGKLDAGSTLARAGFFFARDLVKPFGPLEELRDHLSRAPTLRVLDLGAGMGATSFGIARWLRLAQWPSERLEVLALEQNASALRGFSAFAKALGELPTEFVPVSVEARAEDLRTLRDARGFDLIAMGFVLNELFNELPLEERVQKRTELVLSAAERLDPGGVLLILEPALKETTRELMMLRDRIAARGAPFIIAPCLHDQGCPMLPSERDWCHQELAYALPPALADVARRAQLRWEGLSYASLALSTRPRAPRGDYRVVSDRLQTKGKLELYGCGHGGYTRFTLLDRNASEQNAAFSAARRGHVLSIEPDAPRIEANTRVERA